MRHSDWRIFLQNCGIGNKQEIAKVDDKSEYFHRYKDNATKQAKANAEAEIVEADGKQKKE